MPRCCTGRSAARPLTPIATSKTFNQLYNTLSRQPTTSRPPPRLYAALALARLTVTPTSERALALLYLDIAFLWMLNKAKACDLAFVDTYVASQTHPDVDGELRKSKKGFYQITKSHVRAIGAQKGGHESAHQSAVTRMESGSAIPASYQPENLRTYLESENPVVPES